MKKNSKTGSAKPAEHKTAKTNTDNRTGLNDRKSAGEKEKDTSNPRGGDRGGNR